MQYRYYLERASQVAVLAMSTGKPLRIVSDKIARDFAEGEDTAVLQEYARLFLEALKREMLHTVDADFLT